MERPGAFEQPSRETFMKIVSQTVDRQAIVEAVRDRQAVSGKSIISAGLESPILKYVRVEGGELCSAILNPTDDDFSHLLSHYLRTFHDLFQEDKVLAYDVGGVSFIQVSRQRIRWTPLVSIFFTTDNLSKLWEINQRILSPTAL